MSETEKKGITVKIDADLHAQVRQYIEANGMTMAEFVSKALDDELHPKQCQQLKRYWHLPRIKIKQDFKENDVQK